ncbi:hypothetical protein QR680_017754 [Steinernema hermaphroditum]|uniref:Fucosyltransferase n=1 Tax=Steinernema hermaphroditum TaxID=289476 RepID=A0AA39LPY1_9BILA|nr:hypothetical protein QR680_017754 [Steinernema hermaphroditum]
MVKGAAALVFLLFCAVLISLNFINIGDFSNRWGFQPSSAHVVSEVPIILGYNAFFSEKITEWMRKNSEPTTVCDYECVFTDDRNFGFAKDASMVLFHGKELSPAALPIGKLSDQQIKAFFLLESPVHAGMSRLPNDFFDLIVTYRNDSDVPMPYDSFQKIDTAMNYMNYTVWDQKEVEDIVSKKSELVLEMVSNCNTDSKREIYSREMQKHANVSVVGRCGKIQCNRFVDCEANLIRSHCFYLAFENSVCPEYVTEKFFRMKQLIVPVVLKRSVVEGIAPEGSFVAADDFGSPKELVHFLQKTARDREAYMKYFEWTKHFYREPTKATTACELCKIAWKGLKERKKKDAARFWDPSSCSRSFAQRLLG